MVWELVLENFFNYEKQKVVRFGKLRFVYVCLPTVSIEVLILKYKERSRSFEFNLFYYDYQMFLFLQMNLQRRVLISLFRTPKQAIGVLFLENMGKDRAKKVSRKTNSVIIFQKTFWLPVV